MLKTTKQSNECQSLMITAEMFPIQSFSKNIFFGETKTVTVHASGFLGGGGKWSMREPDCGYDVSRNDIAAPKTDDERIRGF